MVRLVRTSWLPETFGERETCEEREKEEGAGTCIFHTTVDAGVCPPFRFSPCRHSRDSVLRRGSSTPRRPLGRSHFIDPQPEVGGYHHRPLHDFRHLVLVNGPFLVVEEEVEFQRHAIGCRL